MDSRYSRPIRFTQSGVLLARPCVVSNITISGVNGDCYINIRELNAGGQILWSGEADNASSSFSESFEPPMRFFGPTYIELVGSTQSSAVINVIEP